MNQKDNSPRPVQFNSGYPTYSRPILRDALRDRLHYAALNAASISDSPISINSSPRSIGSTPLTISTPVSDNTPSPSTGKRLLDSHSTKVVEPVAKVGRVNKLPKKASDFKDCGVFETIIQDAQRKRGTAFGQPAAKISKPPQTEVAVVAIAADDILLQAICEETIDNTEIDEGKRIIEEAKEAFEASERLVARGHLNDFEALMDNQFTKTDDVHEPLLGSYEEELGGLLDDF